MPLHDQKMSSNADSQDHEGSSANSRDVLWYTPELETISPQARELFEKYSHIAPENVTAHIEKIRERAWDIFPFPCIGHFHFLDLSISAHPCYQRLLSLLKDPITHHTLLDLGCCFAQDIRKLIYDGVPSQNLYACDLQQEFIDLGYDLFADKDSCKTHFFTADVFKEGGHLNDIEGKVDAIYAASFLHLFSWDDQITVCKRIIKILKPRKGSFVFGRQTGNVKGQETVAVVNKIKGKGTVWKHNAESFKEIWNIAGRETGTRWKATVWLDEQVDQSRLSWHEDGARKIVFEVERLE